MNATSELNDEGSEEDDDNSFQIEGDEWYYINEEDEQIGPISHKQLKKDWDARKFSESSQTWCPEMSEWQQVDELPELMKFLKVNQKSEPLPPPESSLTEETKLISFPSNSKLGISYSGNLIVEVAPKSKASELGVCIGWRILVVNGKKQPNNHKVILSNITQNQQKGGNIEILFNTAKTEDLPANVGTILVDVLCRIPILFISGQEVKVTISLGPGVTVAEILKKALQTLKSKNLLIDSSGTNANNFGLKRPNDSKCFPNSQILKNIADSSRPEFWMTQLNQVRITRILTPDKSKNPESLESHVIKHEYSQAMPEESTLNVLFEKFVTNKGFKGQFLKNIQRLSMASKWHILCQNIQSSIRPDSIREGFLNKSPPEDKWKNKDVNALQKYRFLLFPDRFDYKAEMDARVNKKKANKMSGSIPLDATTQVYADQSLGIQNAFVMVTNTNQLFCLQALTQDDRDSWVVTLSDIISCIPKDKKNNNELVEDMMLGIRISIGKLGSIPASERLSKHDMQYMSRTEFKSTGSKDTPPHKNRDFYFKDYAPKVFRRIRARFGIDPMDYMLDVCGNSEYLEFISNSKSGQFFFHTHNRKYMIKTISHNECKTLMNMLSAYYRHLMSNKDTLLTPFFGLHKVTVSHTTYWFLIMGSVFPTDLRMHFTFDLKGSTRHRQVKSNEKLKEGTVYKDNDFIQHKISINVGQSVAERLKKQLLNDVNLLSQHNIIDYSILLGVHYLTTDEKKNLQQYNNICPSSEDKQNVPVPSPTTLNQSYASLNSLAPLSTDSCKSNSQSVPPCIKTWKDRATRFSQDLQNVLAMDDDRLNRITEEEFTKLFHWPSLSQVLYSDLQEIKVLGPPNTSRSQSRSFSTTISEVLSQQSCFKLKPYQGGLLGKNRDTIFFIGIIDTLIEYNIGKKCEHKFKTKVKNLAEDTISVVAPDVYATRFLSFINKYIE